MEIGKRLIRTRPYSPCTRNPTYLIHKGGRYPGSLYRSVGRYYLLSSNLKPGRVTALGCKAQLGFQFRVRKRLGPIAAEYTGTIDQRLKQQLPGPVPVTGIEQLMTQETYGSLPTRALQVSSIVPHILTNLRRRTRDRKRTR